MAPRANLRLIRFISFYQNTFRSTAMVFRRKRSSVHKEVNSRFPPLRPIGLSRKDRNAAARRNRTAAGLTTRQNIINEAETRVFTTDPASRRVSLVNASAQLGFLDGPSDKANERLREAERVLTLAKFSAYVPATDRNYTYAVLRFVRFAEEIDPCAPALPASPHMVSLWLASGFGRTGPGYAGQNLAALAAWHRLNGLPFATPSDARMIYSGLLVAWPKNREQKRLVKKPVVPRYMIAIHQAFANGSPLEQAVLAVAKTAWAGQMRLGEILPQSAASLDRAKLPRREHWRPSDRLQGSSYIRLPWTKTTKFEGDKVSLLEQHPTFDASTAIMQHFTASRLPADALICEYVAGGVRKVLDKPTFMAICNDVWMRKGWPRVTGHSFRIGGTTSLLLAGVNPEVVKMMGRWSSNAFQRYWRTVDQVFDLHARNIVFVDYDP